MAITYGRVAIKKVAENAEENETANENNRETCHFCRLTVDRGSKLTCLGQYCNLISHIICLSEFFLKNSNGNNEIVPVEGDCPLCDTHVLWGDLIRKKKGCYKNLTNIDSSSEFEDEF